MHLKIDICDMKTTLAYYLTEHPIKGLLCYRFIEHWKCAKVDSYWHASCLQHWMLSAGLPASTYTHCCRSATTTQAKYLRKKMDLDRVPSVWRNKAVELNIANQGSWSRSMLLQRLQTTCRILCHDCEMPLKFELFSTSGVVPLFG